MLSPEFAKSLADLGGFAMFLFTVVVGVVGLWRQWWVPGWLYNQERQARITAEIQAIRNAEALDKLARAMTREPRAQRPRHPVANAPSPHDPE